MCIILKENETMKDVVKQLGFASEWIYDVAPIAYWYENLHENGRIKDIHFSGRMRSMLGYSSVEEFPDGLDTLITHIHPEDVSNMLDNAIAAGTGKTEKYDVEYRIRKASGEYMWCNATGRLVKDSGGKTVGMYGSFIDISDKKALEQERIHQMDKDAIHKVLAENNSRILALEDNFVSLYDVDLETGCYEIYAKNHLLSEDKVDIMTNNNDFFGDTLENVVKVIVPEDREGIVKVLNREYIRTALERGNSFDWYYRLISDDGPVWAKMRITYKDREKNHIVVGVFNAGEEMKAKQTERQLKNEIAENYSRFLALEDDFEVLYDIELKTGHYDIFVKGQTFGDVNNNLINNNSFFDDVEKNLAVVHPEDRQGNYDTTRPEFIREALLKDDHFDRYYRLMVDGQPAWARMRIVYKNADKRNIIIGVFNAENDVRTKQLEEQKKLLEVQHEKLREALERSEFETRLNDMLTGLVNGAKFTYDISAEDEITGAHYPQISIDRIGEEYTNSPKGWLELLHPDDREAVETALMATVRDRKGNTPYDVTFRMMGKDGNYRWVKSGGNAFRRSDGSGTFYGMSLDITEQMEEQQKRLLGAIPISPDTLNKANIGLWSFELDEGSAPRMYGDETMLKLVGLDHQVTPEEMYHAWYDNIDEGSYDLVNDAVAKMRTGEHAEVQYPWHYPDGRTIMVRCGGVQNFEYTKGIRIEGTHQDVTQTLHFDEEERKRAKQTENDLLIAKLRADSLAFISDNEPDLNSAINFFGKRILEITGCDQVVYREISGRKIVLNAPGSKDIPETICSLCPFARFDCEAFEKDGTVLMNDCNDGFDGIMVPGDCPAKSSFMQMVSSGGNTVGKLTVHYLNNYHTFTENEINIMRILAVYLGLMIGRIKEKQADIARIEAESSNKAKTEFLFNMSHDIRTPMNAILGYTDIAINHIDEPGKISDSLKKIKTSGGHLLNLINDILEMSRIEAGRLEIVSTPLNIYRVSEGVINMSQSLAAAKDINFRAEIGELENPYIYADELHTNQIIINLISNAIKYTKPGGTVDYLIEQISNAENGTARYRVTVKDNGIGMSEEFQKHLFESFSREQSATVSKQEGAGLGLAIVKKIVDLSGGTISVRSKQGEGSVITVELPLEVMDEDAIKAFEASCVPNKEMGKNTALEGKRVLLVEDNEMNREIATEILEETGLIVETAEDGSIAVRKVSEKDAGYYDFILMDIQMPVMNGYEATAEIRRLPEGGKVPIIALSANAFKEDVEKSLSAGMNAHVAKPINIKELLNALAKFM